MKWRSPFVVVVLVMMPVAMLMATPTVHLFHPPPGQYYLYQIWKLTLINPDPDSYRVQLKGTITEAQQGVVFTGLTKEFTLQHNTTKSLKYGDPELTMAPGYPTYASGYKEFAIRTGGLPPGRYTFTVWLLPDFGSSSDTFTVRPMGPPRLVKPTDGDTVRTQYPQFVWTRPAGAPGRVTYELALFEVMPGQTPDEALRANPPWFTKIGIAATSLTYPTSARPLDTSKAYAWQVTAATADGQTATSEVRTFTRARSAAPHGAPRLMSPKDGATLPVGQQPLFSWTRPMPPPTGHI